MPPNGKIRVLVVDDSALMRQFISDILNSDPRIEVAGTARDGKDALVQIKTLNPDLVTMDVEMPNMDGLKALEEIMKIKPLPVIMVSSLTQSGAETTMRALALGCVDFIGKPSGTISLNIRDIGQELINKVIAASTARVIARPGIFGAPKPAPRTLPVAPDFRRMTPPVNTGRIDIVAIASSTGGPMALSELIPKLPKKFPVPIVITQHMPKEFTPSFAKRLNDTSEIEVVEGFDGLSLKAGRAVVAPGGSHLIVKRRAGVAVCGLSDAPPVLSVKPAANIMFLSVADEYGGNVLCVILTGMGRDGTDGAVALKRKGAYVIAESQKTCVVYGMPKAAVDAGVVDEVLPLNEIPDAMVRLVKG
ncbi:MAG: chemotaxis response regulator protein-glutamate methylesterase [Synergistales bacterium]|nr:chemotaxis response regulator protein-glutamate methylesterase [Synergistales bacterium]MDY6402097.1 chemotaxis response regulator protein-glutamate methylesterase [Synergistales bacterium]MDY6405242.1 chemotaxis response regulator protein-glutamate methylesterase [Synergistales bacterium]MDY6410420.1 chemotaxis response regulator protein-glutamate methylesterase [Synergistales bacterium]MDY6413873.1 chemotaxis response regulator protein-glutamate methylesterase [Synergistales bacterium]